jgi:hypothetical protein
LVERERTNLLTGQRYTWLTRPGPAPDLPCDGCVGGNHQGWGYLNYPQNNNTALTHASVYNALVRRTLTQTQWASLLSLLRAWVANIQYCGADETMRQQLLTSGILQYPNHQQRLIQPDDDYSEFDSMCSDIGYWGASGLGMFDWTSGDAQSCMEGNYNYPDGYDFTLAAYLNQTGGVSAMTSDLQDFFSQQTVSDGTWTDYVTPQQYAILNSEANNMMVAGGIFQLACRFGPWPPADIACAAGIAASAVGGLLWVALHDGLIQPR